MEWVNIHVPKYPPLAKAARIHGMVAIEIRFKGCELNPESTRIVSGHPLLVETALQSLKQSALRCGDFPDSATIVYYEFVLTDRSFKCDDENPKVEVTGSNIRVFGLPNCVQTNVW